MWSIYYALSRNLKTKSTYRNTYEILNNEKILILVLENPRLQKFTDCL